jgi:iron(III) transport system substrate-binding protein
MVLRIILIRIIVARIPLPSTKPMSSRLRPLDSLLRLFAAALVLSTASAPALAQDKELNLYTARHYQTDEALYTGFTKRTGIKINRIEGGEDALFERIKSEGARSPADVFITVDIGRIWKADEAGIFEPVKSPLIESRIPASLRDPENKWFGFSSRARIIVYNKAMVKDGEIKTYEDLADPKWRRKVCVRSSSHPYMLSLTSSIVAHLGERKAEAWVKGLKDNLARDPQGGDTDQIKAAASGECALAITNQYYFVRLLRSGKGEDQRIVEKLGYVFPNQDGRGTHINISGGGMLKHAPHKAAARAFLEYLASDEAQSYFANGNNEWPAVPSVKLDNPALQSLGTFKTDPINVAQLGKNQAIAQRISDRVGYK